MGFSLRRADFPALPGWADDRLQPAFEAFRRSARHATQEKPYRSGALGIAHEDMSPAYEAALACETCSGSDGSSEARRFFETWFRPVEIVPDGGKGFVTGYYEPVIDASAQPDDRYRFPFLSPPPALQKVPDPENPPPGIPRGQAFMVVDNGIPRCCPDRAAIESGVLDGQGLEIAWAASRADVFFAHVQGCARLRSQDGQTSRITYAAKSGHPFTGIGRLLVERGEISSSEISMASIRAWLAANPDRSDALMRENRSFIFFRQAAVTDDRLGPIAAAKVALEPGRSLAVDRTVHSFGTPVFVHAPELEDFDEPKPFSRLMIAQDTGTAIVGPARGDLFAGSGPDAGDKAGSIKAAASFYVLAPRGSEVARQAGHDR